MKDLREAYDKYGKTMVDKEGPGMDDAAGFFAKVFGGDRFEDYIGQISLMKEMTNVASAVMTDEEKAEVEQEMKASFGSSTSPMPPATPLEHYPPQPTVVSEPTAKQDDTHLTPEPHSPNNSSIPTPHPITPTRTPSNELVATPNSGSGSGSASPVGTATDPTKTPTSEAKKKGKQRLTPEQRAKLEEVERERRKRMEERVEALVGKLIDRIRPFLDVKNPQDLNDPEIRTFMGKMQHEAEDLKLESFGIELLHTIGMVYASKASTYFKSKKFFGIGGFWSKMKEKGSVAKDAWGVIGSALSVQTIMHDMERLQTKGEAAEEELRALEMDMTGKLLLASWRGTRFEVMQVLREVCDKVLRDPTVTADVRARRATAMLVIGDIFRNVQPDETDEERRELERMVAEAAAGKSKHEQLRAERQAALKAKRDAERHTTPSPSRDALREKLHASLPGNNKPA